MLRSRIALFTAAAAALVLASARGHGQTTQRYPLIVDLAPPPAIVEGVFASLQRAPDSIETKIRAAIRTSAVPLDRVGGSGAHYIAGRLIVKFKSGASPSARASAMAAARARASSQPSYADFEVMSIDPSVDAEDAARALQSSPDVEYAQPAYRVHAECASGWGTPDSNGRCVPNDAFYDFQWNLPDIDAERAWNVQPDAAGAVTVAVLDTGIAYTNVTLRHHASAFSVDADGDVEPPGFPGATAYPALGDLTLSFVAATDLGPSSRFVSPRDFIWDTTIPVDMDGHGTHVSGTIGEMTNNSSGAAGVAYNVKLMPVKVLDTEWDDIFGSPNFGTDDTVARGIRYAADNGAKVINMSIGRTGPSAPAVEDAIRYAVGKGVFVAIAGGNDFEDGNPTETYAEIANRVKGAVSVAAIDRAHNRSYFSSTGTYIEIAAPGGSFRGFAGCVPNGGGILQQTLDLDLVDTFMLSPSNFARTPPRFDALAYFCFVGTSQATPHVSGLAAMLVEQGYTDPGAIEAALEKFAIDPQSRNPRGGTRDNDVGFGEISARATLRGLGVAR